jgi:GGDEF domain-containing protein
VYWLFSERYDRLIIVFELLSLAVFAFIIAAAVRAWRKGVVFGGYWLMVYVPYLLCISLTLANSAGFVNAPWLPNPTPILAAIAEAVAMMLCINAYGRLRHAQAVREQEAARYDPLTGFLKEAVFNAKAAKIWNTLEGTGRDVAIVYVTVEPVDSEELSTVDTEALMAFSVRQVRTIAREFDLVGRLGRNRIGIVMIGMAPSEALSSRLARLVALGLMRDTTTAARHAARLGIDVGSRRSFAGDFNELDAALRDLSARDDGKPRPIRYLNSAMPVRRTDTSKPQQTA